MKDNEIAGTRNSLDYGARMYDSRLGRWKSRDPLEAKYPFASPYNFALNTPIQAKDPDGKVVIFINGQHGGDGGQAKYWAGYDTRAMHRIGDHSARYVDGALGGFKNTASGFLPKYGFTGTGSPGGVIAILTSTNVSAKIRENAGSGRGYFDALSIINNLGDGESIKIVTHSMGTAYARGYVQGVMQYAKQHGLTDKIKFEFELDINAFEGKSLPASGLVKQTFNKTGGKDGGNLEALLDKLISVPSVAPVPGATDITTTEEKDKGHAIDQMGTTNIPQSTQNSSKTQSIEEGVGNVKGPL